MFGNARRILLWAFLFFLVLHAFIFRDIIFHLPQLLSGQEVIAREELIPFFDSNSQFFSQIQQEYSPLTSSNEVRISYSFLTSWVRYYKFLPIALIVLNALSAFFIFCSFFYFAREYFKKEHPDSRMALYSILPTLIIHFLLLFSKITHFYTLIFGFALFSLALSLLLIELLYRDHISWKKVILITILVLINPAIHYHVLFYLCQIILFLLLGAISYYLKLENRKQLLKKNTLLQVAILLFSLIPYFLFILSSSGGTTNVTTSYEVIKSASLNILQLFTLDASSQLDMFLHGTYILKIARWQNIVYFILILFPLFFYKEKLSKKQMIIAFLWGMLVISFWFALGFTESYSFHNTDGYIMGWLSNNNVFLTSWIIKINDLFIQILRLPHRFQLISYVVLGLLLTITMPMIAKIIDHLFRRAKWMYFFITPNILLIFVILLPIATTQDYIPTLASGNFNNFIMPWPISKDLQSIREILSTKNDGKLLILPSMESGRNITEGKYMNSFIDKFFIYYLNYPTLYYGASSDLYNKIFAHLLYRSIIYNENWWQSLILNSGDIRYLLILKNTVNRSVGPVYADGFERNLHEQIQQTTILRPVFKGDSYELYAVKEQRKKNDNLIFIDLLWENFLKTEINYQKLLSLNKFALPFNFLLKKDLNPTHILTDNPTRAYLDLFALLAPDHYYPLSKSVNYYVDNIVSSDRYANSMFSLFTLYDRLDKDNAFRYTIPGLFPSLTGRFIGLRSGGNSLQVPISIKKKNTYAIYLRQYASKSNLLFTLKKGQEIISTSTFTTPTKDLLVNNFFYVTIFTGQLDTGNYTLEIKNSGSLALMDGIIVASSKEIPTLYDHTNIDNLDTLTLTLENKKLILRKTKEDLAPPAYTYWSIQKQIAR